MRNFRFSFSKRIAAWSGAGNTAKKSDKSLAFGRGLLGGSGFRAKLKRRLLCETLESRQLLSISQPAASCDFPIVEDAANTAPQESRTQTTVTDEELQAVTLYMASVSDNADVDINALPSPENVTASAQDATTVQLHWTAVDGATGYRIERIDNQSTEWTVAGLSSSNTYTDRWLDSGTSYRYRVYALSGSEASEASDEASVTTATSNRLLITNVVETETSITFYFSQEIDIENFERMKDSALTLIPFGELVGDPVSSSEITYTSLSLTWTPSSGTIPTSGNYTLELSAPCFQAEEGGTYLYGGIGGLRFSLATLGTATLVQQGEKTLQDGSYSVPLWTDWNGDGLSDLVVGMQVVENGTTVGKVKVYLNSGTATAPKFAAEDAFFVQYQGSDLTVVSSGCLGAFPLMSDYDGDGKADLWIGQSDGSIWIYRNTGTAGNPLFETARVQVKSETEAGYLTENLNVGNRAAFTIADMNNDGRLEIYIGNVNGQIFYANEESSLGDGVFSYPQYLLIDGTSVKVDAGRTSPVIVDLNNDGRQDLVVGDTNGYLWFFENVGTTAQATFLEPVLLTTSDGAIIKLSGRSRPTAGDYNGDGRVDLIVGCSDGTVSVFLNAGWGTAYDGSIVNWDTTSTTFNYVTHLPLSESEDIVITPTWPTVVTTGESTTFAASATGGTGTLVYRWYLDGATTPFATSNTASHTFTDYGTHTVQLVVSDADGKSESVSHTWTVRTNPSVAITDPGTQQADTPTHFEGTLSQDGTPVTDLTGWTITWNFGDESENVNGTLAPTHTFTSAGTYTVTMTAVDSEGRSSVATQTVVVNDASEIVITPTWPTGVTVGQETVFSATAEGGEGDLTFVWYLDDAVEAFATGTRVTHTFVASGSHTITLKVSDSEGETASVQKTVSVHTVPTTNINAPETIYAESGYTFTGTLSQDGTSVTDLTGWTIAWNFGDGSEVVTGTLSQIHTYQAAGTYTVTLTATDSEGRSGSYEREITVEPASSHWDVTPEIVLPSVIKEGTEATLTLKLTDADGNVITDFTNVSVTWTFSDSETPVTVSGSNTVTKTWTQDGVYTVSVIATNGNGQTTTETKATVTVENVAPVVEFVDMPESITAGVPVDLYVKVTDPSVLDTSVVSWYFDGATTPSNIGTHIKYTFTTSGEHTIRVTANDGTAIGEATITVNVLASKAPTATITDPGQVFEDVEKMFHGTLTVDGKEVLETDGAFKDYTVTWNFGDGSDKVTGSLNPLHTYANAGTYTVTLTITYNADTTLSDTKTFALTVLSAVTPTGSITPPDDIVVNTETTFTGSMNVGGKEVSETDETFKNYTITWDFGDGSDVVTGVLKPKHTYTTAGEYTVTMKIVYNADTTISDTKTVKVTVLSAVTPVGTITPPDRVIVDEEAAFTGSLKVNGQAITETDEAFKNYTVTWDFGDGTDVVTGTLNAKHTYTTAGDYTVTLKIVYNADTTIFDTQTVKVTALSDKTPTGSITAPDKIVKDEEASFAGTLTVGGKEITETDEAFKNYTITWDFGDGTDVVTGTLNAKHTYTVEGDYTVTLKIVYNDDTTISDIQTVLVGVEKSEDEPDLDAVTVTLPEYVVPYQPANVTITVPDGSEVTWTATIDWGDGSDKMEINGKSDLNVWHAYQKAGDYTITIVVGTQEFTTKRTITESLDVRYGISQGADPYHTGETSTFIALSPEQTRVILEQNRKTGEQWLRYVNSSTKVLLDTPTVGGQFYIYASDQSSSISVTTLVTSKVTIIGGAGNDYILGGAGTNVLVGGEGDDWIFGGVGSGTLLGLGGNDRLVTSHGHNVVVGGTGDNRLSVHSDNDLVVAGSTSYDDILASATHASESVDFVAYEAIFSEWTSGESLSNRQTSITSGVGEDDAYKLVPEETVFGSGTNVIVGGRGDSWIVATEATDPVVSLTKPGTITAGTETKFTGSITQNGVKVTNTTGWTIEWDFGDGTTDKTGTLTPKHTYTKAGSYTVRLTTTDPKGRSGSATMSVSVTSTSEIIVVPTWPSAVTTNASTTFKAVAAGGSGSYTYKWYLGDATTPFATSSSTNYTFKTSGTYTVKLVVSDTSGKSTTVSKEFSVKSTPTLSIVAPESPKANVSGTFSGTLTQDGKAVTDLTGWTIEWDFGDKTDKVSGTLTPTHTYAQGGTYTVTMTATDSDGRKATKTLSVVVETSLVEITWPSAGVEPNEEITCTVVPSTDGVEQSYHWLVNGVSAGKESTLKYTFTAAGDYVITLEVTEGDKTETITHTIPVKSAPVPAVSDPGNVVVNKDVPFTGTIAQDDKPVTDLTGWTVEWDFGDKTDKVTGTLKPEHKYTATGEYTITLTTTDSEGRTGTATYRVTVIESSDIKVTPTWPTAVVPDTAVEFTATASGGVGSLTYAWYQDNISTPFATTSSVSRAFTAVGTYTIKLVVTDANGDTATVSKEIVVKTAPTLTAEASTESVKSGDEAAFTGTITQNGTPVTDLTNWVVSWNFGDESAAVTGTLTPKHTYTDAGTYTVTFTASDSEGRTATKTLSIVVTTNLVTVDWPAAGIKPNDTITCTANPADPKSELTYTWKIEGSAMSNTATLIHVFDAAGSYTVTLEVTDTSSGQVENYTHTLVVKSSPDAAIADPGILIAGETNDFSATLTQDGSPVSDLTGWVVSWNFGDGSDVVTGTLTPEHSYTAAGTYTVSFTASDSEGRTVNVTRAIVVSATITLTPTWPTAIEPNETASFVVVAEGGTGELTYAWYLNDATEPFATTATAGYTFTDVGAYTVRVVVTDSVGLTASQFHSVVVQSIPETDIEEPQNVPVHTETTLTATLTQDGVPVTDLTGWTIVWNFGDTTSDTTGTLTPKHTYTTPGEYTITLNVSDPEGRVAVESTQTILVAGIEATIERWSEEPLCPNDMESFSANVKSWGEVGELSYLWSMNSTNFSTDENAEYTFTSAGTYTLTLTVTDGVYSSTATLTLSVHAEPTATITAASSGMTGKEISFKTTVKQDNKTVTDLTGWTIEWDFGDGEDVATGSSLTHIFETEGTYYVTVTVTDPDGRETSTEHEIEITQTPEIEVFSVECSVDGVMPEEEVEFWPDFETRGDVGENLKYYWYLDGTRLSYVSTSQDYVTLSFEEPGEHTIKCRVWEGSVYGENEVTITVKSAPEATLSTSTELPRVNDVVTFSGVVTQDGQTITDFTDWAFAWNFGGSETVTTTTPSVDHAFTTAGTYTVTLTLTDPDGRTNAQTCVVTVQETALEVSVEWPVGVQPNQVTDFSATVTKWTGEGTLSYRWYLDDAATPFIEGLEGSFIFSGVGEHTIRFVATDGGENTVSRSQTIQVAGVPVATLTASTDEAKTDETVTLTATVAQDGQEITDFTNWNFEWNFGDGSTSETTQPNTTKEWTTAGEYDVTLTTSDPEGRQSMTVVHLTITQGDWDAVAAMTVPASIAEGSEVELILSLTDGEGTAITDWTDYQITWDFGDQTTQTVQTASTIMKTWSRGGTYTVKATITNPDGQTVQTQQTVTVQNVTPVVVFSSVPDAIRVGEAVTLEVTVSDPGVDSSVIQWYFGDETTASRTGSKVVYTFASAGDYLVRVTANDGVDVGSAERTFTVLAAAETEE